MNICIKKVRLIVFIFQISVFDKEIRVTGLTGGEKYVFAVAAYSSDGELIGGSIGKSTNPILASHPSSLLSAWSFLAQVVFQQLSRVLQIELDSVSTVLLLWFVDFFDPFH